MLKDPLRKSLELLRSSNAVRAISISHDSSQLARRPAQALILRSSDARLARHQEAFIAAALRHEIRSQALMHHNRTAAAAVHYGVGQILLTYARPEEIDQLPLITRRGPQSSSGAGVHPAMVVFAEGTAEEFCRAYLPQTTLLGRPETTLAATLMPAFRRANFHCIYIARLHELARVLEENHADSIAEATLLRRYGPQSM